MTTEKKSTAAMGEAAKMTMNHHLRMILERPSSRMGKTAMLEWVRSLLVLLLKEKNLRRNFR